MNNFRNYLDKDISKLIDFKIKIDINLQLEQLAQMSNIEKYIKQIQNRKKGLAYILGDFDNNLEIIEQKNKFKILKGYKNSYISYEKSLDKVIQKVITSDMEKLYKSVLELSKINNDKIWSKIAIQIADRQIRISSLLEDYEKNIKILMSYYSKASIGNMKKVAR